MDPEDAQKLLDPAIHIMMESVHRFEGTVNQVLGDGIMSLFGAHITHEDHAARACYAALAMQSAMQDYTEDVRRRLGLELRIRVGLNSGEVVVQTIGNDLHMDYSAVGQTTHLAARMEQLASPGSIRLSSSTLRLVEHRPELVAHHCTEAGMTEQAVGYWQQAGQEAVQRSANAEAIGHYTKALEGLRTLPDTSERTEQELVVLLALGAPSMVIYGYGSPEAEHVYAQAHLLCQKVENSPHLFPALWGYNRVCLQRAEFQVAREVGEQLLGLGERAQDPARLLEAHFALGAPLYWMGEFDTALFHMKEGRRLYDPQQHRSLMLCSGHDHEAGCLTYEARALWFLGYPDQALARIYETVTRSQDLSHPFSLARALLFVGALHQYRREVQQTQEQVEELLAIARAQDFALQEANGTTLWGWSLAMQGQEEGVSHIHQGLSALRAAGSELMQSYFLALLAEGYAQVG